MPVQRLVTVLGAGLALGLLLLAAPSPAAALRQLGEPAPGDEVTAPLLALVSLVAWSLASWLGVVVALTAGAALPGHTGRLTRAVGRRIAPTAVRRVVAVALGMSAVAGVVGAPPAAAAPGFVSLLAAPSPDWAAAASPDLDWVGLEPAGAAIAPTGIPTPAPDPVGVVVQPGDSLWSIAADDLTRSLGRPPSEADVARAWPAWWTANREAVGADPDLVHPGLQLSPPDSPASS